MRSKNKTALITGITGQDGSYLAELLLEKGYRVVGMTRRSRTDVHERIEHIVDRVEIVSGDLLDQSSITSIVSDVRPDEIYNLAAQSFVPTSWTQPVLTGEFTALGVTRVLEAVRAVDPAIRFYQASSSEMFGKVRESPQTELTPFHPRSPYGVAKVYGHYITVNYRESYDIFATSGICFNHESVPAETPVIVRREGLVDVLPVGEILRVREKGDTYQRFDLPGLEIWDGNGFVSVQGGTAYRRRRDFSDKGVTRLEAGCGTVTTTADHVIFTAGGERKNRHVKSGDRVQRASFPEPASRKTLTADEAWMLGAFVGGGPSTVLAGSNTLAQFVNANVRLREFFTDAWQSITGRTSAPSGRAASAVGLKSEPRYVEWLREECYTQDGRKRVPKVVLNGDEASWNAFLQGYDATDGVKDGDRAAGRYMNFKTDSPVLAMGLWWMARIALKQECLLHVEAGAEGATGPSYAINVGSTNRRSGTGARAQRDLAEVRRKVDVTGYDDWLYDFTTTTERFAAGVGECIIHNSPRRGKEFVTRKITDGVARIKLGLASELRLGNIEAKRDWGFALDYVEAMWLMLQHATPEDFVIATGRTYSVRDFVRIAFGVVDLDFERYIVTDPKFYRPAEVDILVGDPGKAKKLLGWEPRVSFEELVAMMVRADLDRLRPLAAV